MDKIREEEDRQKRIAEREKKQEEEARKRRQVRVDDVTLKYNVFSSQFFSYFVDGVSGARAHARGATSQSQSQSNSAAATTITHYIYIRSNRLLPLTHAPVAYVTCLLQQPILDVIVITSLPP